MYGGFAARKPGTQLYSLRFGARTLPPFPGRIAFSLSYSPRLPAWWRDAIPVPFCLSPCPVPAAAIHRIFAHRERDLWGLWRAIHPSWLIRTR